MGALWVIAYRVFGASINPDRSFALAIAISYTALALITLVAARGVIPRAGFGGVMVLITVLVVTLGLGGVFAPRQIASFRTATTRAGATTPMAAVAALVGVFFSGLAFACVWAFADAIGVAAGFDRAAVGTALSSNLLITGVGSLLASMIGPRFGRLLPLIVAFSILGACMIALTHVDTFWVFASALAGLGLGVGLAMPFQLATVSAADSGGKFVTLIAAAQGLGAALGPISGGLTMDAFGAGAVGLTGLAAVLTALAALLIASRLIARTASTS